MSTEAKNIRLEADVFTALEEAATREHKTVDEMAGEAVMAGLRSEGLARVQSIMAKGLRYGAASGITEEQVVDVIHASRLERSR